MMCMYTIPCDWVIYYVITSDNFQVYTRSHILGGNTGIYNQPDLK